MSKTVAIIIAVVTLVLGLVIGFFVGRIMLERQWRQPVMQLDGADRNRLSQGDPDPVPPAGSKLLKPMPLERSRLAMKELTKNDPVTVVIGSFGNGDDGSELHIDVVNGGTCVVTGYSGVAYGFDAWGTPQKANKNGEHFVAFSAEKIEVEPGKHHQLSAKLRYPETVSLAVAQIDNVTCKGAPPWSRQ